MRIDRERLHQWVFLAVTVGILMPALGISAALKDFLPLLAGAVVWFVALLWLSPGEN